MPQNPFIFKTISNGPESVRKVTKVLSLWSVYLETVKNEKNPYNSTILFHCDTFGEVAGFIDIVAA